MLKSFENDQPLGAFLSMASELESKVNKPDGRNSDEILEEFKKKLTETPLAGKKKNKIDYSKKEMHLC